MALMKLSMAWIGRPRGLASGSVVGRLLAHGSVAAALIGLGIAPLAIVGSFLLTVQMFAPTYPWFRGVLTGAAWMFMALWALALLALFIGDIRRRMVCVDLFAAFIGFALGLAATVMIFWP